MKILTHFHCYTFETVRISKTELQTFRNTFPEVLSVDPTKQFVFIFPSSALKSTNFAAKFSCSINQVYLRANQTNSLLPPQI